MKLRITTNTLSTDQRQQVVEAARAAGRRGSPRVPDSVLFAHGDPNDTAITAMVDGLFEGHAEREKESQR